MNFLQLCQRTRQECGISGTGPSTVVGQTGEMKRVVDWVNSAWMDIQASHEDWGWLRTETSFATVAGQATYDPTADIGLTDFGVWARKSFRVYDTSVGTSSETRLTYKHYDQWRDTYQFGAFRNSFSRPVIVTVTPDEALGFGPVTAAGYTILGDYFKAPSEMSVDADTPELPARFHMAIVYRAMMFYGGYDVATEVYQRGELEFAKMMNRMTANRLPEVTMGGPLA